MNFCAGGIELPASRGVPLLRVPHPNTRCLPSESRRSGVALCFANEYSDEVWVLLGTLLLNLISLLTLVLWIVLMLKAFQGVRFKVPLAGDIAESLAGRAGRA